MINPSLARAYAATYTATHRAALLWSSDEMDRRIKVLGDVARRSREAFLLENCIAALDAIADVSIERMGA